MSELDLDALEKLNAERTRESETDNTPLICECGNKEDARFIAAIANSFPALLRLARRAADAERERDKALREADREDRAHVRTLEERDAIQDLFDELYEAFFGEGPEYSSIFNATDAFNEMDARLFNLKSNLRSALSRLAALKEKCAPFVREAALWPEYCRDSDAVFIADVDDVEPLLEEAAAEGHGRITYSKDITVGDLRELARAVKEGE